MAVGAPGKLLARMHELVHRVPVDGLSLPAPFNGPGDGDVLLHREARLEKLAPASLP